MATESRAPSIGESQQGGNSEAPCSSGCVHVSEELLLCVRGEVINFDDLWDWATDLGWDLAEMPHPRVFRTILCLISALAGWDLSRSASHAP